MKKYLILIVFIIAIISCSEEQQFEQEAFLKVRKKNVEYFESGKLIFKEFETYSYNSITDFFWESSVETNSKSKDTILTKRYFEKKTGLPIKEIKFKNGEPLILRLTKYSSNNFELIESKEFQFNQKDTFLISKVERHYDDGYLISEKLELFSKDFTNTNGTNLFKSYIKRNLQPKNLLPKGNFNLAEFYEYYIEYQTDSSKSHYQDTLLFIKTNYDKNGLPTDIFSKSFNEKSQQFIIDRKWFVNELDEDSLLISITAYENESRDSIDENSYKIFFIMEDNLISEVQKYLYFFDDKDFNRFSEMKVFEWKFPEFYSRYNFTDYDYSFEGYDYQDSIHTYLEKRIVRWDDVGLKVIEYNKDSYRGEYETEDFEPKLFKRITYVFDKVEKNGPKVIYKKNKKY